MTPKATLRPSTNHAICSRSSGLRPRRYRTTWATIAAPMARNIAAPVDPFRGRAVREGERRTREDGERRDHPAQPGRHPAGREDRDRRHGQDQCGTGDQPPGERAVERGVGHGVGGLREQRDREERRRAAGAGPEEYDRTRDEPGGRQHDLARRGPARRPPSTPPRDRAAGPGRPARARRPPPPRPGQRRGRRPAPANVPEGRPPTRESAVGTATATGWIKRPW